MIIYTLWHRGDEGELPWIIDAVDGLTVEKNCEFPPEYLKKRANINVRELIIDVPGSALRALFESPAVKAKVIERDRVEDGNE